MRLIRSICGKPQPNLYGFQSEADLDNYLDHLLVEVVAFRRSDKVTCEIRLNYFTNL